MIESVTPRVWNLLLIMLTAVLAIGLALVAVLARGAADPPRDSLIVLELTPEGTASAPFTVETTADEFTLMCGDSPSLLFQVRRDGYFSVSDGDPLWAGFHHIRRDQNTLYLHVNGDGALTFRINAEIAWTSTLDATQCAFSRMNTP